MTPPYSLSRDISAVVVPSKLSSWRCSLDQRWGLVELCGHNLGRLYGGWGNALGTVLALFGELFGEIVNDFRNNLEPCFEICFGN